MRLIDQILNCPKDQDEEAMGMIGALASIIRSANPQCFEISKSVVEATMQVFQSKPSSVLSALPYARLPYRAIWIERVFIPEYGDVPNSDKPPPKRVGSFVHYGGEGHENRIFSTWAWSFDDEAIIIAPFSIAFDMQNPLIFDGLPITPGLRPHEIEYIRTHKRARWHAHINVPGEIDAINELASHWGVIKNPVADRFWNMLERSGSHKDRMHAIHQTLIDDLSGEDMIVVGFLLMLNSKNAISTEREDLTRLNRARARKNRRPLTEFNKTTLAIPHHLSRRFGPSMADRAAARMHMVRGHWKVRKSGVYWWSPHARSKNQPPVSRMQYTVKST